jgi:two-component system, NarL family, nitrate/nitrite response regulator NarL
MPSLRKQRRIFHAAKSNDTINMATRVQMIRLLVVGDQPAVRKGLNMRLAAEPDLFVIGEAMDKTSVIELATSLHPQVVLIDLDMLYLDGISTAQALRMVCPQAAIILLSMYDDLLDCEPARNIGAVAFIAKSLPTDNLLATIRQVAS